MSGKIVFGRGISKADMRAAIAAANISTPKEPMASADQLKMNSNVPSMNFRGTASWTHVNSKLRCER